MFSFLIWVWVVALVLGCVLDCCIGWWVALFSGLLHWFWEVLCVLRDLRVELLGGFRNGVKA